MRMVGGPPGPLGVGLRDLHQGPPWGPHQGFPQGPGWENGGGRQPESWLAMGNGDSEWKNFCNFFFWTECIWCALYWFVATMTSGTTEKGSTFPRTVLLILRTILTVWGTPRLCQNRMSNVCVYAWRRVWLWWQQWWNICTHCCEY